MSAKNCVQISFHWLGNGGQYHAVSVIHGISKATVCRIIGQFVTAVNNTLFHEFVTWPDNVRDVVQKFYELGGLPLVCGCIDGTLIKIDAPRENEEAFVDRHGNHSINCMAVYGPDLTFYYIDANWPGRVDDARVLRNSSLFQRMQNGWRPIPDGIILGDSGYPLPPWLILPTEQNPDNAAEIAAWAQFLRRHKKTRRVIECAFELLKENFLCLNHLRVIDPRYSCEIFKCCVTLCNFSRSENDVPDLDGDESDDESACVQGAENAEFSDEEEIEQQNPEEARIVENRLNELVRYCRPKNQ